MGDLADHASSAAAAARQELAGASRRDKVAALLELAAADDATGFRAALAAAGGEAAELADGVELWYGRSKAYEPRTSLIVAAAHGSAAVVALLLGLGCVDVNRRPGVDGATALHCAASGGSPKAVEVVKLILAAGADPDIPDSAGRVPADVVVAHPASPDAVHDLEALLGPRRDASRTERARKSSSPPLTADRGGKKGYPADPTLPDMSSSVFATDAFRMFAFKVQPCARAYAHDWTECPFAHPGENARRRDPRRHAYTAVPCSSFRLPGGCPRGDGCDFAHGVFESWLHPSQYRTRLCRDGAACERRVCFFAHAEHELRHVPRDTAGADLLSPRAMDDMAAAAALGLLLPGFPSNGGGVAAHCLQQGNRLLPPLNASWDAQVDDLGALLDIASLSRSQPRLSGIMRRPPVIASPPTYMALPPSRFSNAHGGPVYSPAAAQTSQLLNRIRQQQNLLSPPVMHRQMFDRSFSSLNKQRQVSPAVGSPAPPPLRDSDASWVNCGSPNSKIDWSFDDEELHRYG